MQSEVRKLLDGCSYFEVPLWWQRVDAAERADAARREEPVRVLRKAVSEFAKNWHGKIIMPSVASRVVGELLAELNAIIATKPDAVEDRQATASGPSVTPTDEHIRAIATKAVRDAMPDVLETVADAMKYDCGFDDTVDMIYMYAARLRKERGV